MIRRHLYCIALLITAVSGVARAQSASTEGARLEYARSDRAASCPDASALKAAVTQRLGYDPFVPAAPRTVFVEVTDVEGGLHGQMHLVDVQGIIRGVRELRERADHCDELVASLALAISIALDPSAAPAPIAPRDTVATPEPPAIAAQPPAPNIREPRPNLRTASAAPPPSPTQAEHDEDRARFAVRAGGFGARGTMPKSAFGVRFGGSVSGPWFRFITELSDQLPVETSLAGVGGVRLSRLGVSFAPCLARYELAACAVLDVGSLHAAGTEILDGGDRRLLDVLLGARLEYTPSIVSHLKLVATLEVGVPLDRTNFEVHRIVVWKTPAIFGSGGLGLAWQF